MAQVQEKRSTLLPRLVLAAGLSWLTWAMPVHAVGTRAGTLIESVATVDYTLDGADQSANANTVSFLVAERIDVLVAWQGGQTTVVAGDTNRSLLFAVTNTGNGDEAFALGIDSLLAGDDFDPQPSAPGAIYFDSDASGDFSVGDVIYVPGDNEPVLEPDESLALLLVNDMPGGVADGQLGRSELRATAVTGSGQPGTVWAGLGDGGLDAVNGTTGGSAAEFGEYVVDDVEVSVLKSQAVVDPDGGSEPVTGATITYTITVEVIGPGTAAGAAISDLIPTWCTYLPGSLVLNGASLSDAIDADAGEYDTAGAPRVLVRLGDLTEAGGTQTVSFQVEIS